MGQEEWYSSGRPTEGEDNENILPVDGFLYMKTTDSLGKLIVVKKQKCLKALIKPIMQIVADVLKSMGDKFLCLGKLAMSDFYQ